MSDDNQNLPQRFFVFWRHDSFPFVKGGEMSKMFGDGSVEVKCYSSGYRFIPIKIFPLEAGQELYDKIVKLEREYKKIRESIDQEYYEKIMTIVPFMINSNK